MVIIFFYIYMVCFFFFLVEFEIVIEVDIESGLNSSGNLSDDD